MIDRALCDAARGFDSATLYEANGRRGALPREIKPIDRDFVVAGPAFPVEGPPGDNLWLHWALAAAKPGDVLVASVRGGFDHGYWGEVMSTAARARGLAGLVIDGCVRDGGLLAEVGLPVFARGLCITGTTKDPAGLGSLDTPLLLGDVVVRPGDLVFGDRDGVVAIAADRAAGILAAAETRRTLEAGIMERLKAGETTVQIYGLPSRPCASGH